MAISSGFQKVKDYIQEQDQTFKLLSRWTSSQTVEYSDGKTAQEKNGVINGITSDVNCEDPTIAASASMVGVLNQNLPFALGVDANGNYGYYKAGADTVTPFNEIKESNLVFSQVNNSTWSTSTSTDRLKVGKYYIVKTRFGRAGGDYGNPTADSVYAMFTGAIVISHNTASIANAIDGYSLDIIKVTNSAVTITTNTKWVLGSDTTYVFIG